MFKHALLVFLGACSFGILSTFAKLAYKEGFTPAEVAGIQITLGMTFLWILFLIRKGVQKKPSYQPPHRSAYAQLMLCGVSTGSVSILYYQCVQLVPASIAIVLLMQFVWMGTLLDYLLFKIRPSKTQILCAVAVLLGTVLAAGMLKGNTGTLPTLGVFLGLLAALAYALFLMVNGRVGNAFPAVQKSALMMTGAFVLILVVFPPTFLFNGRLWEGLWLWGVLLALFGTVIPPLFYAIGIPKVGIARSGILSSAELPVAVAMSYFVLGETVTWVQWLGVVLILLAIIFPNLKKISYRS